MPTWLAAPRWSYGCEALRRFAPTELVSMADMMDCWVCSLLGTPLPEVHSKKQYRAEGKPKQITSMHVRLEIPPGTVLPRDLYLALQSRFGLALAIKTK